MNELSQKVSSNTLTGLRQVLSPHVESRGEDKMSDDDDDDDDGDDDDEVEKITVAATKTKTTTKTGKVGRTQPVILAKTKGKAKGKGL